MLTFGNMLDPRLTSLLFFVWDMTLLSHMALLPLWLLFCYRFFPFFSSRTWISNEINGLRRFVNVSTIRWQKNSCIATSFPLKLLFSRRWIWNSCRNRWWCLAEAIKSNGCLSIRATMPRSVHSKTLKTHSTPFISIFITFLRVSGLHALVARLTAFYDWLMTSLHRLSS